VGRHGLQERVTGHVGQAQLDIDLLPRAHHLSGIADPELSHQHAKLWHRGRRVQIVDDVGVDFSFGQEPLRRATL
jgi:hypothetical protein